jgi:acyl-homoserine lactone acylase PvdQ
LKARIPNEQNPYILNPTRNFCASANQNPVDENYPYYTNGHYENYRNRVINDVHYKQQAKNYTWKDMAKTAQQQFKFNGERSFAYFTGKCFN